jgi:cytoskeleton protein RodZ
MADEQPLDFGAELTQARERKGLTLEQLSRRTKIGLEALKAIERCDMQALPGGLYTRGFLRAYAREVGSDPDEVIRRYRERFNEQDQAGNVAAQLDTGVSVTCAPGQVHVKDIDAMTRRRSRTAWLSGVALVLLGAAIHFAFGPSTSLRIHRAPVNRAAETQADASSTANASPSSTDGTGLSARRNDGTSTGTSTSVVGTSGSPPDPAATHPVDVTVPTSLHLDVKPSGSCWLSATADGQRVLYRLMNAGERTQIEAKDELVLLVGDPATCSFDINGAGVRQLGSAGQPVTVHLTRQNFQQYLERPVSKQN